MRFLLLNLKKSITFAPVISPRLGIMSLGWAVADIIKASLRAMCLAFRNLANSRLFQRIAAF